MSAISAPSFNYMTSIFWLREKEIERPTEVRVQEAQEQALEVERRAIGLVQKNTALERRLQEMKQRARESERQDVVIEMEESPSSNDTGLY